MIRYVLLMLISLSAQADSLQKIASEQGATFIGRGKPYASTYYHDATNVRLDKRSGSPGTPANLLILGEYKYMRDGEWLQEAVSSVQIDWGDGDIDTFVSGAVTWPLKASHVYGLNSSSQLTINEETAFTIIVEFTTFGQSIFSHEIDYVVHMNESGFSDLSRVSKAVNHYWENNDCVMRNGICYIEELNIEYRDAIDLSVPLVEGDIFYEGNVSYFQDTAYEFIQCGEPYSLQPNGDCTYTTSSVSYEVAPPENIRINSFVRNLPRTFDYPGISGMTEIYHNSSFTCYEGGATSESQYRATLIPGVGIELRCSRIFEANICYEPFTMIAEDVCLREVQNTKIIHDSAYEACRSLFNFGPEVSFFGGTVVVESDFSCYEAITIRKVCFSPFEFDGAKCMREVITSTPVSGETSSDIPKDTYRRN